MDKDILIEVFKSKSFDIKAIPKEYSYSYAFDFYYNNDLVDIRIFEENKKCYIQYETII